MTGREDQSDREGHKDPQAQQAVKDRPALAGHEGDADDEALRDVTAWMGYVVPSVSPEFRA